jgi:hypothetical protein
VALSAKRLIIDNYSEFCWRESRPQKEKTQLVAKLGHILEGEAVFTADP